MKTNMIKNLAVFAVFLFSACSSESIDGTYVAKIKSEYSIADDTIIIKGNIMTNRVGFQRIINGQLKPKEYRVKRWKIDSPEAPVFEVEKNEILLGSTSYKLIDQ